MKRLLFLLLIISWVNISFAQNDTIVIKKSTDKVIIGGQAYYVHIVKKGETLFSLSNAYNVSQKDIAKENPEIFLGLQVGQALKIPVVQSHKESIENKQKDYIYHRVKKGQTLFSLSKKYNVSQEDIITCNPTVRYGINIDQIVKIPKSQDVVDSYKKIPESDVALDTIKIESDFIYHKVEKDETIFSLTRLYEISEELFREHNPEVDQIIQIGQVLKIPKIRGEVSESMLLQVDETTEDSTVYEYRTSLAYSDSIGFTECDKGHYQQSEPFQVALMLPFYLDENDEEFYVDSSEVDDFGEKIYERVYYEPYHIYPKSYSFIEFYEGLLLSLDSLKRTGISVNLHVYDTAGDTTRVKEILEFPELKTMDLIIGPVFNDEVKLVSEFSKNNNIKVVSPLMDNLSFVDNNPNMFQIYPSFNAQIDKFAKYVAGFHDKNIIMVHTGDSLAYGSVQMVKDKIFSYISYDTLINNIQFKEVVFADSINVIEHALDKEKENIFIVPSNDEAFVTDVVTNLNTLKTFGQNIKVIGLSRWQRFSNVDPEYYFNLNLSIATPFFIDYHQKDVKDFVLKYRDIYSSEPSQMSIHGYDVGFYFFSALNDFGPDFSHCILNYEKDLLQANYRFVKWYHNSGFENVDVSIIKYFDGYNILKVNDLSQDKVFVNNNLKE